VIFDDILGALKMRTTLSIDDDVLAAAKGQAQAQGRSIGDVISDLARQSLRRPIAASQRNGIPLLPVSRDTAQVTLAVVNTLRDESA
jgi:hypothetical protein